MPKRRKALRCHIHPKTKLVCPACLGSRKKEGSKEFLRAANRNLKLAHKARRKYTRCPRYASHHFSPVTGRCPCGSMRPAES